MAKKENRTSRIGRYDRGKEVAAPSASSALDARLYLPRGASGAGYVLFLGECFIQMALCFSCDERTSLPALRRDAGGVRDFARRSPKCATAQCHRAPCAGSSDRCRISLCLGNSARKGAGGLDWGHPTKCTVVSPGNPAAARLVDSSPHWCDQRLKVGISEFEKPHRGHAPKLARNRALTARKIKPG